MPINFTPTASAMKLQKTVGSMARAVSATTCQIGAVVPSSRVTGQTESNQTMRTVSPQFQGRRDSASPRIGDQSRIGQSQQRDGEELEKDTHRDSEDRGRTGRKVSPDPGESAGKRTRLRKLVSYASEESQRVGSFALNPKGTLGFSLLWRAQMQPNFRDRALAGCGKTSDRASRANGARDQGAEPQA